MADALVWQLLRQNNSFVVKRGRTRRHGAVQFSTEPGNLLNVNTFKYSGLANKNTIDIAATTVDTDKRKKAIRVVLSKKNDKSLNKPSKSLATSTIKNAKELTSALVGYRSDLASVAATRYGKLFRGSLASKGFVKPLRTKTTRANKKVKKASV